MMMKMTRTVWTTRWVCLSDGPSRIIRTLVFDVDLSLQDGEVNGDVDSEEEEEEDEEDDGL